jgi:hypothetical protein
MRSHITWLQSNSGICGNEKERFAVLNPSRCQRRQQPWPRSSQIASGAVYEDPETFHVIDDDRYEMVSIWWKSGALRRLFPLAAPKDGSSKRPRSGASLFVLSTGQLRIRKGTPLRITSADYTRCCLRIRLALLTV